MFWIEPVVAVGLAFAFMIPILHELLEERRRMERMRRMLAYQAGPNRGKIDLFLRRVHSRNLQ